MSPEGHDKVTPRHLRRNAYLYVRQSTLRQVLENTESTERQYGLRERAVRLGWAREQIVVIDSDLGQSGASAVDREGFQRLVTEVSLGRAGIVMGLEVSRLARNSADWHRLLEISAFADTLILDEDGLYDPAHFNDRLLLGLKGTMSEAELHILKARLRGGVLSKARRGELQTPLPMGFQYGPTGQVVLDPDQQVQASLRLFFETFRRTGSAMATVKAFRAQGLLFPRRVRCGPDRGELLWAPLLHRRALGLLHNPRYAGAFCFGRTRQQRSGPGGYRFARLPREEWTALFPGAHEGYLSWEEFEQNQRRLRDNAQARGDDRKQSPPREGPALLQGIVVCGTCGERMTVRYHQIRGRRVPDYTCQRRGIEQGEPICQSVPGAMIEQAIGTLLLQTVTPLALEVALAVEQELVARRDEACRLRQKHLERLRYEADLARRRYLQVDPDHRLVADELERQWNEKLRAHKAAVEEETERQEKVDRVLDEASRAKIRALAADFPAVWNDPKTPSRERKRMVRLLVEDVTLTRGRQITAQIRFKGGATETLTLPLPPPIGQLRKNPAALVAEVDRLLEDYTHTQIAAILNHRGLRTVDGKPLTRVSIRNIQQAYGLLPRYDRLRRRGMLTLAEMAQALGIAVSTLKAWTRAGLVEGHDYNDRNDRLYEPPDADIPVKGTWKGLGAGLRRNRLRRKATAHQPDEVQCDA